MSARRQTGNPEVKCSRQFHYLTSRIAAWDIVPHADGCGYHTRTARVLRLLSPATERLGINVFPPTERGGV